jgi:hypothetical protein
LIRPLSPVVVVIIIIFFFFVLITWTIFSQCWNGGIILLIPSFYTSL